MSDTNIYTVGWICALETEYVAAQSFLDEEHEGPEYVSAHDNNDYTLGMIGKHNVVIAVLPNGEYGISSAASVARDMLHSFPNVRIGLMVGIGGGAPSSKHDIRLGDIVVSAPRHGEVESGVFQYDFGKTIQNQSFQPTGFLNQAPMVLRAAINGIKAEHKRKGHQIEQAINDVLQGNPRLKRDYGRPDMKSDRLYLSEFVHSKETEACAVACGDSPLNMVPRIERTESDDNPAIFYGTIASANRLMKDALVRDSLAKEKEVLCFEMEAAGLMNHFPCLVIRGICDYADSHKNKEWQGYASMAAAAYAKNLLRRIPINKIEAEKKLCDIMSSVRNTLDEVYIATQDTKITVQNLDLEQKQRKVESWLSPPDPSTNFNKALQQRLKGSGLWFLQSDNFTKWKIQPNSFLWLHGIPGCGKTILSATIIEHLGTILPSQTILYFYFDFSDTAKQTLDKMIRSLIYQFYHEDVKTSEPLYYLFSSCEKRQRQPTTEELCNVFFEMLNQIENIWIIIDALDECSTRRGPTTSSLLSWIKEVLNTEQRNIHLLVTSRPEQDIESEIIEFFQEDDIIAIKSGLISDDIRSYIHARVREDISLKRWRSHAEVQDEIELQLIEKADGMFRWVACQLDVLEHCLDYRTLHSALASLPKTLEETYSRILNNISSEYKQQATRILQFLVYSERPLRIDEAIDMIATEIEGDEHFNSIYRMPNPREITRYCSSLVVTVPTQEGRCLELQLAHLSVKEYLTSNRLEQGFLQCFQEVSAKASIATVCLAYLLHLNFPIINRVPWEAWEAEGARVARISKEVQNRFPFAVYCARYWLSNAVAAEDNNEMLQKFIKQFFCNHEQSYRNCYALYRPDSKLFWIGGEPASPLYYASFGGLEAVAKLLVSQGVDVNAVGGIHHTALQAASHKGYDNIVELLLHNHADVNIRGKGLITALWRASDAGHDNIVKLLLNHGADVNIRTEPDQNIYYESILRVASRKGHESIVKLLLNHGADTIIQNTYPKDVLQLPSEKGYEGIVKLLLSHGADINAHDDNRNTALHKAIGRGHESLVRLLLNCGADVNSHNGMERNALQLASRKGCEGIVKLLLGHGADINAHDGHEGTALHYASSSGHESLVRLLLNCGADVNSHNRIKQIALHQASDEGHEVIVKLLLDNGADIKAHDKYQNTALHMASSKGHESIARLLLKHGADVNSHDDVKETALQRASDRGHEGVVKLLLENNADVTLCGNALLVPSMAGHEGVVKLLLSHGAPANDLRYQHQIPPLQAASKEGHYGIVELLLNHGAHVNMIYYGGDNAGTALHAASRAGHNNIVKLLLSSGADINIIQYGDGAGTALYAASVAGNEGTVKALLAHYESEREDYDVTALYAASKLGYENIVKLFFGERY